MWQGFRQHLIWTKVGWFLLFLLVALCMVMIVVSISEGVADFAWYMVGGR